MSEKAVNFSDMLDMLQTAFLISDDYISRIGGLISKDISDLGKAKENEQEEKKISNAKEECLEVSEEEVKRYLAFWEAYEDMQTKFDDLYVMIP